MQKSGGYKIGRIIPFDLKERPAKLRNNDLDETELLFGEVLECDRQLLCRVSLRMAVASRLNGH